MGKTNEFKDDFLKGMFKKSHLDTPSDNFTANVMNRIQVEVVEKVEADKPIIEPKYWLLIGLGLVVAAYMLFQMDWSFMQGVFGELNIKPIEMPQISFSFLGSLQKFINTIQIPTVLIITVAAVVSLITLDKILKQRFNTTVFFF
jgi:hypothetical protein